MLPNFTLRQAEHPRGGGAPARRRQRPAPRGRHRPARLPARRGLRAPNAREPLRPRRAARHQATASTAACAIGALTTLAEVAARPRDRRALPGAGAGRRPRRPARSCATRARSAATSASSPRCWYYRGDFHCLRKGGDMCFAAEGENQLPLHLRRRGLLLRPPLGHRPRAGRPRGASVRIVGPAGSALRPGRGVLRAARQGLTRETVLDPGEIVTEIVLPPQPAGARSTYRKVRARGSWDFALAGAAVVATRHRRARRQGAHRSLGCGADSVAGAGGRARARGPASVGEVGGKGRGSGGRRRPSRWRRTPTRSRCCAGRSRRRSWRSPDGNLPHPERATLASGAAGRSVVSLRSQPLQRSTRHQRRTRCRRATGTGSSGADPVDSSSIPLVPWSRRARPTRSSAHGRRPCRPRHPGRAA